VTGNTHRAEFCIDKLYSPDGPSGRLGLLEMRAFEMPPHARMSLVQQLMLRALVAPFLEPAVYARLTRWGTGLHDRFMLPTFREDDLEDVLAGVEPSRVPNSIPAGLRALRIPLPALRRSQRAGHPSDPARALEPWHVLGEEPAGGATARYVDSSVERVELQHQRLNDNRMRSP